MTTERTAVFDLGRLCEVCGQESDEPVETFLGDVDAHPSCVPTQWREDTEKRDEFQREIERRKGKNDE